MCPRNLLLMDLGQDQQQNPAVYTGGGSVVVAVAVSDMWHVTCDPRHITRDTWHMTKIYLKQKVFKKKILPKYKKTCNHLTAQNYIWLVFYENTVY